MKTLTSALLFNLFASYLEGMVQVAEELPAAYDNFVTLLGELPQNENQILKLRRLNSIGTNVGEKTCLVRCFYR